MKKQSERRDPPFRCRVAKVGVTKYRILHGFSAGAQPALPHRTLPPFRNTSRQEPYSASTVWVMMSPSLKLRSFITPSRDGSIRAIRKVRGLIPESASEGFLLCRSSAGVELSFPGALPARCRPWAPAQGSWAQGPWAHQENDENASVTSRHG